MYRHYLRFKDKTNEDFGAIVLDFGYRKRANQEKEEINVPFSNRSNVILYPAFEPYRREVTLACPYAQLGRIYAWLTDKGELEVSVDPDVYFIASSVDVLPVKQYERDLVLIKASFLLDPFAYLKSGKVEVSVKSGDKLYNPGTWTADPICIAYGNGSAVLYFGGIALGIPGINGVVVIDSLLKTAVDAANRKHAGLSGAFPVLGLGSTRITYTSGIDKLKVIPRWREL